MNMEPHETATIEEIKQYFTAPDKDGKLQPEFVNGLPESQLRRMAELMGERFNNWFHNRRNCQAEV